MRCGLLPVVCFATGSVLLDIKALWHPASEIMHKIFAKLYHREYNKR